MGKEKILVIAHGHPDFVKGGGEKAAYNLYKGYKEHPDVEKTWFLARINRGTHPTGMINKYKPDEYLWDQSVYDWFYLKAVERNSVFMWFKQLIESLQPTIVHAHHYAHIGLEYLSIIKQINPSIKIVFTLHEYMALCYKEGQMLKTYNNELCFESNLESCRTCFPDRTKEDFWLRNHRFKSFFEYVDLFISPSEFLKKRYIDWGLPEDKIVVIENGLENIESVPPRKIKEGEKRNRFGFFGQINQYKGLDVVLRGLHSLPLKQRKEIVLEINGIISPNIKEEIESLMEPLIKEGIVIFSGPYHSYELRDRMATVDWVIVPSIWWENSPVVIQEAFACGRPVLVSNIGGMAEKVKHGVNGLHVPVENPVVWVETMLDVSEDENLWDKLRNGITKPLDYKECADKHIKVLKRISYEGSFDRY